MNLKGLILNNPKSIIILIICVISRKSHRNRLSIFIIPFLEQIRWGPLIVKVQLVRKRHHVAEFHVAGGVKTVSCPKYRIKAKG